MFKLDKLTLATIAFLIIIFGINATAKADPVTLTLENPILAGPLGSIQTLYGTITNVGAHHRSLLTHQYRKSHQSIKG